MLYNGEMDDLVKLYTSSEKLTTDDKKKFPKDIQIISLENEKEVWLHIMDTVQASIDRYPTTLQEDTAVLKRDSESQYLTNNERNCIQFRSGEKKILNYMSLTSILILEVLDMSREEAEEFA